MIRSVRTTVGALTSNVRSYLRGLPIVVLFSATSSGRLQATQRPRQRCRSGVPSESTCFPLTIKPQPLQPPPGQLWLQAQVPAILSTAIFAGNDGNVHGVRSRGTREQQALCKFNADHHAGRRSLRYIIFPTPEVLDQDLMAVTGHLLTSFDGGPSF
jgi:hypothetical protein